MGYSASFDVLLINEIIVLLKNFTCTYAYTSKKVAYITAVAKSVQHELNSKALLQMIFCIN